MSVVPVFAFPKVEMQALAFQDSAKISKWYILEKSLKKNVCPYIYICMCVCVCVYIYMYVCMHTSV